MVHNHEKRSASQGLAAQKEPLCELPALTPPGVANTFKFTLVDHLINLPGRDAMSRNMFLGLLIPFNQGIGTPRDLCHGNHVRLMSYGVARVKAWGVFVSIALKGKTHAPCASF